MKRLFLFLVIVSIFLPAQALAQGNGLTQHYDDGELSFSYPTGWNFSTEEDYILVSNYSDEDTYTAFFVAKTSLVNENYHLNPPSTSNFDFLAGFYFGTLLNEIAGDNGTTEFSEPEEITINEHDAISVTYTTDSEFEILTIIDATDPLLIWTISTGTDTEATFRAIIQTIEYDN